VLLIGIRFERQPKRRGHLPLASARADGGGAGPERGARHPAGPPEPSQLTAGEHRAATPQHLIGVDQHRRGGQRYQQRRDGGGVAVGAGIRAGLEHRSVLVADPSAPHAESAQDARERVAEHLRQRRQHLERAGCERLPDFRP
jgi:hypothetical protein